LASRRINECLGSEVENASLQLGMLRKDWQYALVIIKEPRLLFDLLSNSCVSRVMLGDQVSRRCSSDVRDI
jgi:hypothetical protein